MIPKADYEVAKKFGRGFHPKMRAAPFFFSADSPQLGEDRKVSHLIVRLRSAPLLPGLYTLAAVLPTAERVARSSSCNGFQA